MSKRTAILNVARLEPEETASPSRKFMARRRHLSEALGSPRDGGPWNGGHPFDVEHVVVPAGKANYPFHAHGVAWEFYWVLGGKGTLRLEGERILLRPGDFFVCPPGEAHQLVAGETADLEYLVIADNVRGEVVHYPESGKWLARPGRLIFRERLDYYDGEDE